MVKEGPAPEYFAFFSIVPNFNLCRNLHISERTLIMWGSSEVPPLEVEPLAVGLEKEGKPRSVACRSEGSTSLYGLNFVR